MSTVALIALGAGLVLIIISSAMTLRRRERRQRPPGAEISPEALAEARRLVAAGEKIKAVKVIREDTDMDLEGALAYAESLETGEIEDR